MTASSIPGAPRFVRTQQAAAWLGLSHRTLEKHRTFGTGPAYRKLGGRVLCTSSEVLGQQGFAFLAASMIWMN
jgi:hypothetical protein